MNKNLALFVYLWNIPKGLLLRLSGKNRCKVTLDKNTETYRCKPDNVNISSQKSKSDIPKNDDEPDCPDTMYPMW
ncbi:MAG: hypothetical protein Q7V05_13625 [Methanoregula sp.]|nr:hypothetical protein [Methanoregula sp.]